MKTLFIGDVVSSAGCEILLKKLPFIKRENGVDLCIVNGENAADGNGMTKHSCDNIFAAGADVITGGNHSLRKKEFLPELDRNPFILRPHNLICEEGSGYCLCDMGRFRAAIINLMGELTFEKGMVTNPFAAADELIKKAESDGADYIFADFHAETTAEKRALGFYLDGKVSAVVGTHTHVQTNDLQILPLGTGYITDLGMTGVINSVLGVKKEIIIARLKSKDMSRFEWETGKCMISGALFDIDEKTKQCNDAKMISIT